MEVNQSSAVEPSDAGRRKFLATAGKFAAVTPPAVAMLMSTSLEANALSRSCIGKRGNLGLKKKIHGRKKDRKTVRNGRNRNRHG
jgi:hypothetical protein